MNSEGFFQGMGDLFCGRRMEAIEVRCVLVSV